MKRTLEVQRIEFANQKFLATPLAGLIVLTLIGVKGIFFPRSILLLLVHGLLFIFKK